MTDYLPGYKRVGKGPLVVFLHGLGGNQHAFDRQLSVLGEHFTCVAWDVPGYTGTPTLQPLSFALLSQCLDNLLNHLEQQPYALVGHSLGGMVIQNWLADHEGRGRSCEKVVLAQTSARFGKPGSSFNEKFLSSRLQPVEAGQSPADFARQLIQGMFYDPGKVDDIEAGVATMASISADAYRAVIECLVTFDELENLRRIQAQVLCLAGEHDQTAPPKTMQQMAQTIPHAQYLCLAETGHLGYLEVSAAFTQALTDILTGP